MPSGVRSRLGVLPYIGIRVHALPIVLGRISSRKPPDHRIVIPEIVVQQPRLAIQPLPREVIRGRHRALSIACGPIGGKELCCLERAIILEDDAHTAQQIPNQVVKCVALLHGYPLSSHTVELGGECGAASDNGLGKAIERHSIGGGGSAPGGSALVLQDAVALVIVEIIDAGSRPTGGRPAR